MRLVFVSNFLNHHQIPFCEQMIKRCDEFYFVATENGQSQAYQVSQQRDYLVDYKKEAHKAKELIQNADVVVFGGCSHDLIESRMKENKLSFIWSERHFKKGTWRRFIPKTRKAVGRICKYKDKNLFVLCASAFLPYDLSFFNFPKEKYLKWGYFPELKKYDDINKIVEYKEPNSILWVGRFIDWKHPELAVEVARRLKNNNVDFTLNIIGSGVKKEQVENLIVKYGLQNKVKLLGSMSPEKVREYMEKSQIFLFTSNRQEGWGAVLNESMNSACAVVASSAIGSVPYLLENNKNGCIFKDGKIESLYEKTMFLLNNRDKSKEFGVKAYETLSNEWNTELAAERLLNLVKKIKENDECSIYTAGPCSKAEILNDRWFKSE